MGGVKRKKSIPEVCEETLRFQSYIEGMDDGVELSWSKIEHDTGIKMNEKNKAHLRTGIKRANREYLSIYGYGIRLADPEGVMPILTNRLVKIDRSVRRGEKSQKLLHEQFFRSLSEEEQKNVLYVGAVFGAIRVAAESGKSLFDREDPKMISAGESIPYDAAVDVDGS